MYLTLSEFFPPSELLNIPIFLSDSKQVRKFFMVFLKAPNPLYSRKKIEGQSQTGYPLPRFQNRPVTAYHTSLLLENAQTEYFWALFLGTCFSFRFRCLFKFPCNFFQLIQC